MTGVLIHPAAPRGPLPAEELHVLRDADVGI